MNFLTIKRLLMTVLFAGACALCAVDVRADISYGGVADGSGAGVGNSRNLLTLDKNKKDDPQWGSVEWDPIETGLDRNILSGLAVSGEKKSQTISVGELRDMSDDGFGYTSDNFRLYVGVNQTGSTPSITINDFQLLFYDPTSSAIQFEIAYTAPLAGKPLPGDTGGGNWDHFFNVDLGAHATEFDDGTLDDWRVGMRIAETSPMTFAEGGAEEFGFQQVPEPSAIALWSLFGGLGMLMAWRKRRQKTA